MQRLPMRSLVLCALALTACPGRLEDPDRFLDASITCTTDYVEGELFVTTCGGAGCHAPARPGGSLDLESAGVKARLAGASTCAGHPLSTFMLEKLEPSPPCNGSQMPLGKAALTGPEKACLSAYLASIVDAGTGDASVTDAGSNHPPVVDSAITAPASAVAGAIITLSILATDADGDALSYTWSQLAPTAKGTFDATNKASVTWYSPVTTATTNASFSVSVTDGKSTPVTRTATVSIGASHWADVYSSFISPVCSGCHGGADTLTFGGTQATAYTAIVGVGQHHGAGCADAGATSIITAGDPSKSLLFWKVQGTDGGLPANGACGVQMPKAGAQLTPDKRVMLESWIRAGAKND